MRKADVYTAVVFLIYSAVGFFYIIPTQIQYSIPPEDVSNAVFLPTFFPTSSVVLFALVSLMLLFGALRRKEAGGRQIATKRALLQVGVVFVACYAYVQSLAYFFFWLPAELSRFPRRLDDVHGHPRLAIRRAHRRFVPHRGELFLLVQLSAGAALGQPV